MKTKKEGDYQIAGQALEVIVGMAASKVEGVAGLYGGMAETLGDLVGKKKTPTRGIRVSGKKKEPEITLHLTVDFGYVLKEVGEKVQASVKEAVFSMTGLKVKRVNVLIKSINFPQEPPKKSSN